MKRLLLIVELLSLAIAGDFNFDDCGHSRSCMTIHDGCLPGNISCTIVSWKFDHPDHLEMSLIGAGVDVWLGFGLTASAGMKNADIYYCINGTAENNSTTTLSTESAFSATETAPTIYQNQTGISNPTYSTYTYKGNNSFVCTFDMPASVVKNELDFNLTEGLKWSIILAKGPMNKGVPDYHGYSGAGNAVVSPEPIEFYNGMKNVFIGGAVSSDALVKTHATLMLIGWGLLVPLAMASVAMLKLTKYGKDGVWFKIHQALVYSSLIVTVAAFVIIFVHKKSWSSTGYAQDHAILGCLIMFLMLLNVCLGVFRPAGDSANRYIFNLAHHCCGYSALTLSIATVALGLAELYTQPTWAWVTYVCSMGSFLILFGVNKLRGTFKIEPNERKLLFVLGVKSLVLIGTITAIVVQVILT